MPGLEDVEAIAVYPTNVGSTFRVPTVERQFDFEVHLEAEAGNEVIGPGAVTPYTASIQVLNISQFAQVAAAAPANAVGTIGELQPWDQRRGVHLHRGRQRCQCW